MVYLLFAFLVILNIIASISIAYYGYTLKPKKGKLPSYIPPPPPIKKTQEDFERDLKEYLMESYENLLKAYAIVPRAQKEEQEIIKAHIQLGLNNLNEAYKILKSSPQKDLEEYPTYTRQNQ
jgi:hypothetical protein